MGLRKSVKRPRSDRGNGPGGSVGRIPLGTFAMLAIAIVHDSGQHLVNGMILSFNWASDPLWIYRLGVAIFGTCGWEGGTPCWRNSNSLFLYLTRSVPRNTRHAWKQLSVNWLS